MTLFSDTDLARLTAPHICRAWFVWLDLPAGAAWLHSGTGRVTVDDIEWLGVTDPTGGRLLALSQVVEPRFGQAAAVTLTLTGVSAEFLAEFWSGRSAIEGRSARIWWAAIDQETQEIVIPRKLLFARGRMTSPKISTRGVSGRTASLTIESLWSTRNFPPGGRWNPADQRRRYPGDKGLDFVGVDIVEIKR